MAKFGGLKEIIDISNGDSTMFDFLERYIEFQNSTLLLNSHLLFQIVTRDLIHYKNIVLPVEEIPLWRQDGRKFVL